MEGLWPFLLDKSLWVIFLTTCATFVSTLCHILVILTTFFIFLLLSANSRLQCIITLLGHYKPHPCKKVYLALTNSLFRLLQNQPFHSPLSFGLSSFLKQKYLFVWSFQLAQAGNLICPLLPTPPFLRKLNKEMTHKCPPRDLAFDHTWAQSQLLAGTSSPLA